MTTTFRVGKSGYTSSMSPPKQPESLAASFLEKAKIAFIRAVLLKCPACGEGAINASWLRMHERCPKCELDFRRESGFYLGSIYFNYGLTGLIVSCVGAPMVLSREVSFNVMLAIMAVFCVAFPIWFLRYARSMCIAMDHLFDRRRAPTDRPEKDEKSPLKPAAETSHTTELLEHFNCPFCHAAFRFASRQRRTWSDCPECGEKVFLLPSRPRDAPSHDHPK